MNELKVLGKTVLERAAALAEVRLRHLPWASVESGELTLEALVEAVYLDGVRDAMVYLEHLLDESAEA